MPEEYMRERAWTFSDSTEGLLGQELQRRMLVI